MSKFLLNEKFYLPIIYIILGVIIYNLIKVIINKIGKDRHIDKKKITIISLIKNIIKYIVIIFVVLGILSIYGVNTTSIMASIGVVGLVVGLALQDIIMDFLAGVYILFDDHYTIGDIVSINGFIGEVINFGLMSTKIKGLTGEVKIVSNSSFKEVTNYSVGNLSLLVNIDVSYDTDIDKLEKALESIREEVLKIDNVIGNYKLLGIREFASSSIKYVVSIDCKYVNQYQIRRDYNRLIRKCFLKYKIEIPYNKLDVYVRGNDE